MRNPAIHIYGWDQIPMEVGDTLTHLPQVSGYVLELISKDDTNNVYEFLWRKHE